MALDFKSLMGKDKPAPIPQIKPVSEVVATTKTNGNEIKDIELMLSDRTIPLSERIRLRNELKAKQAKTEIKEHIVTEQPAEHINEPIILPSPSERATPANEQFALSIVLNKKQQLGVEFAKSGKSFVLTGKAGTGKTTTLREVARALLEDQVLGDHLFGYYKPDGIVAPSIAFTAYTNRATDNMRRAIHKDPYLAEALKYNVLTIHKLLEYTMEWVTNDEGKTIPHFYPKRNAANPLDITHLLVEESSMVDIPLWRDQLFAALRPGTVVIFVGDINQLPPVFGPSVLNYALTKLPVVELDEVYRQALDSPILANALRTLDGLEIQPDPTGKLKLYQTKPGGKSPSEHAMAVATINTIKGWHKNGQYNPETDIILSPFNKERFPCSTKNLNYHIAQYLGDERQAKVHHVQAGRNTWYLAVGDRVMISKQDGTIKRISMNAQYIGKTSLSVVCDINRFGKPTLGGPDIDINAENFELEGYEELNVDNISDEEKTIAASHIIDVEMDDGTTECLSSAGDFSDAKFCLGYCLSVHKAQGSEWRKVIFVIHKNFKVLLFRELIYTAMTRAKEELVIVDMSNALSEAIKSQRIKGNSVKEKIEWFNSKLALTENVEVVK